MVIVKTAKKKKKLESVTLLKKNMNGSVLGTVHFLRGRGDCWDLRGVTQEKWLKRGPSQKKREGRGGHAKYFSLCTVDMMFYY